MQKWNLLPYNIVLYQLNFHSDFSQSKATTKKNFKGDSEQTKSKALVITSVVQIISHWVYYVIIFRFSLKLLPSCKKVSIFSYFFSYLLHIPFITPKLILILFRLFFFFLRSYSISKFKEKKKHYSKEIPFVEWHKLNSSSLIYEH